MTNKEAILISYTRLSNRLTKRYKRYYTVIHNGDHWSITDKFNKDKK